MRENHDQLAGFALDNARWLLSKESERVDDAQVMEVARELAGQVQKLTQRLSRPEYTTKGYQVLRDGGYERGDEKMVERGIKCLRAALTHFLAGGAPKTAGRVRFALSSAYGARRSVGYRLGAYERGQAKGHRKREWEHAGGGVSLVDKSSYPCDDEYVHVRTGERVSFQTTKDRHFRMPAKVANLDEIRRLPGVKRAK